MVLFCSNSLGSLLQWGTRAERASTRSLMNIQKQQHRPIKRPSLRHNWLGQGNFKTRSLWFRLKWLIALECAQGAPINLRHPPFINSCSSQTCQANCFSILIINNGRQRDILTKLPLAENQILSWSEILIGPGCRLIQFFFFFTFSDNELHSMQLSPLLGVLWSHWIIQLSRTRLIFKFVPAQRWLSWCACLLSLIKIHRSKLV